MTSDPRPPRAPWSSPKLKRIAATLAEGNLNVAGDGPTNGKS